MSLKIMIADDEPGSTILMRSLAAPLDHTVVAFENNQEAGQRTETQRFDVAFVGMRMPESDGLELARRIRNSQANRDTTIVMLSATDDIKSLRMAFGEGADFVIAKARDREPPPPHAERYGLSRLERQEALRPHAAFYGGHLQVR